MKHLGTIQLETDRLVLRRFTVNDAERFNEFWSIGKELLARLSTIQC